MATDLNIPTHETLTEQVARWCGLVASIETAPPYTAGAAGFPRGVMLLDWRRPTGARVYPACEALFTRALPDLALRRSKTAFGAEGAAAFVSFTVESVGLGSLGEGIARPARTLGVRITCEAVKRHACVETLSAVAAALALPGYDLFGGGRGVFVFAGVAANGLAPMSADAAGSYGAGSGGHGIIGTPPPETLAASAGTPLWRVLAVEEVSPIQVVSDEVAAAAVTAGAVPAASGVAQASMLIACTVVPTTVLRAAAALRIGRTGLASGDDAAVRVLPPRGQLGVVVETARFTSVGSVHAYQSFSGPGTPGSGTIDQLAADLAAQGWAVTVEANAGSRKIADLCAMDWRRARGAAGGTEAAVLYVHGQIAAGGGA